MSARPVGKAMVPSYRARVGQSVAGATLSMVQLPGRTRIAISAISICILFMISYAALHALHLAGRDPALLARLSSIPLFSTFLGSALVAIPSGAVASIWLGERAHLLRRLPTLLALAALGLAGEIIFFP